MYRQNVNYIDEMCNIFTKCGIYTLIVAKNLSIRANSFLLQWNGIL